MTDMLRRHPMLAAVTAAILLVALLGSVSIVPETSQGVVTRFGKPVRIVNRYDKNQQLGSVGAGLNAKIPFAETIVWIDKRVRDLDMDKQDRKSVV